MSIYLEGMCNTPEIELDIPTSCYNCDNDCLGVYLEILIRGENDE